MRLLQLSFITLFSISIFASEWRDHKLQLKQYKDKVEEAQRNYDAAVASKNTVGNSAAVQKLLEEILNKKNELKDAVKKYNRELDHVRFEHPEKGDDSIPQYLRIEVNEKAASGKVIGIDGKITQLKNKAIQVFKEAPPEDKEKKNESQNETLETEIPEVKLGF